MNMTQKVSADGITTSNSPFALMSLPSRDGGISMMANYLIKAERVDDFIEVYGGYVQAYLNDWTEFESWTDLL